MPYLFHVSLLIASCYLFYRTLWERETFFQLNRWILITCLLLSFGLPWLPIPSDWSLQNRVVQMEVLPKEKITTPVALTKKETSPVNESIENQVKETIVEQPEGDLIAAQVTQMEKAPIKASSIWQYSLMELVQYAYFAGLIIFALNFLIQLVLLFYHKFSNAKIQDGSYTIVELNQDKAPFSFGNTIFINPAKYDWDTYNQILEHEKIHIQQWHTWDILLAELVLIFQWFNPFAWLYRKAVENNLEYLTDDQMLSKGAERAAYQMNLLKVSVPQFPLNLTTNYNQSFLKKRIAMMNVKKSSASSSWKYLMLLPLLALTVIVLNPIQIDAKQSHSTKEKAEIENKDQRKKNKAEKTITANDLIKSSDANGEPIPNQATQKTKHSPSFIGTMSGSITEESEGLNVQGSLSFEEGNEVIYTGKVEVNGEVLNLSKSGSWTAELDGEEVCFHFMQPRHRFNNYNFFMGVCFNKSELSPMPTANSEGPFTMTREAGKLEFRGQFEDGEGVGKYDFSEDATFKTYLESEGFRGMDDDLLFHVFIADINKAYLAYLKKEGYQNISTNDLEDLAHHQMSQKVLEKYISGLKRMNFDKPTLEELIELGIHDVDVDYIEKMGRNLFKDLTIKQIVEASIHDVDPDYIREIKALGYEDITFKHIVEFAIHDIDADYITSLKSAGLTDLSRNQIVEAAIHDIDPEYIKEVRALGYEDITFKHIIEFAIHDIDANYIQSLKEAGLADLSRNQIVEAAIHDIDPEYIKEIEALGYEDITFKNIVEFAIHDIDADYIQSLKEAGLADLSRNQIVEAAIHDIDPEYIKEIEALGYEDITFKHIIEFAIHDIDANYIQSLKEAGLADLSRNQIIEAAITM